MFQNKSLPLVTIITPAYNQGEYLAETIESVLAQDYPNLEYIVLDDGSTDSTSDVLKLYDGRVRYERHENMGQANTLNYGWGMAKGSLLGYLSSDDLLEPYAVSKLVNALLTRQDVMVAYCDYNLIDAQGRYIRTVATEEYDSIRLTVDLVCQPGPGALFRREIFDNSGGWNQKLRQVPDFEFWLRVSKFGSFLRVPEVLAKYRIHESSASFRPMSVERSQELHYVMALFWSGQFDSTAARSLAMASLISAKNHAQSGRYLLCLLECTKALQHSPSAFLSLRSWRIVIAGIFRRLIYKFRNCIRQMQSIF